MGPFAVQNTKSNILDGPAPCIFVCVLSENIDIQYFRLSGTRKWIFVLQVSDEGVVKLKVLQSPRINQEL